MMDMMRGALPEDEIETHARGSEVSQKPGPPRLLCHSLHDLDLLDAPQEEEFDRLTTLAKDVMNAPVALVSLIDAARDRQYFKSAAGLPEPYATTRQTPLSYSFCKTVKATGEPLIVTDANADARVRHLPSVREMQVIAYLGVPIHDPQGAPIGSFCVIDNTPRDWTDAEVEKMQKLAACVTDQIRLRAALRDSEAALDTAQEATVSRETFFAHIGHEIRTPLSGILGAADLLLERGVPEDAHPLVSSIRAAGSMLQAQLDELLDFAKLRADRFVLAARPFLPRAVLVDAVSVHAPAAERKGVALNISATGTVDRAWSADDHRLGQIIGNLLSNAVKFTAEGEIEARLHVDDKGAATLVVADTGCGMSAKARDMLFEPFQQTHASVQREYGGTGLGLAIVDKLVTAMGGTIAVDTAPGVGTAFTIQLAFEPVASDLVPEPPVKPAPETARVPAPTPAGDETIVGRRVLVADDNALSLTVLVALLERMGAAVTAVETGEAAVEALGAGAFDLALMDLNMPGLDGTTAMRNGLAARQRAGRPALPVYAMSAAPTAEQAHNCSAAGFAGYFEKPIRKRDLAAAAASLPVPTTT